MRRNNKGRLKTNWTRPFQQQSILKYLEEKTHHGKLDVSLKKSYKNLVKKKRRLDEIFLSKKKVSHWLSGWWPAYPTAPIQTTGNKIPNTDGGVRSHRWRNRCHERDEVRGPTKINNRKSLAHPLIFRTNAVGSFIHFLFSKVNRSILILAYSCSTSTTSPFFFMSSKTLLTEGFSLHFNICFSRSKTSEKELNNPFTEIRQEKIVSSLKHI